jgi:hypothetical protein
LTRSLLNVRLGSQVPTIHCRPDDVARTDAATEAFALADSVGLVLDSAQRLVVTDWLSERADGTWSSWECGDFEPRQNGKGAKLEVRQLFGLYVLGEELQIHTAHEFKTANEHFLRMAATVNNHPELRRRTARIRYANGEQGIELKNGCRLKFLARSGGSGRGFTGVSTLYFDEAMYLDSRQIGAALSTMATAPNSQVIYTGSGGFTASSQQWMLRRRALQGGGGRFAYHEWTAETVSWDPEKRRVISNRDTIDVDDRVGWYRANEALGSRITDEFVEQERRTFTREVFLAERLCVWEPEPVEDETETVVTVAQLTACHVPTSAADKWVGFAVDMSPDGTKCAIGVAGKRGDGFHVELGPHVSPDDVVQTLARAAKKVPTLGVGIDSGSAAKSLIPALEDAGLTVVRLSAGDYAAACSAIVNDITARKLSWRRTDLDEPLVQAVKGAGRRQLENRWAWARTPGHTISPLVAVTLARWVAATVEPPAKKLVFSY